MGCKSFIIISLISVIAITSATSAEISPGEYRQLRREKAARPRRVLFNNDAADSRGNFTREEFLARRTDFTVGLVDTIMYCVGHAGFQQVVALPHGETSAYLKTVDVFQWLIDFAHANGQEVFCSFRMNDVHDWRHTEAKPRMSSWKKANRDVLFADSMENKTTLYGFWTAMDYGNAKVRDQHFAIVCDVLDKYDVDGLDFDFSRYLPLFREVSMGVPASPEQREQFTDLMRRIRRAADARGRERGKAILISVVLPDSVDYCRELGADIEQWIREELIDIWTQPEMFRLNTAADAVAAARTRGIPFYPQVGYPYPAEARNPTLLSRLTPESYAARIAAAFAAGAPGVICSDLTCPSEILNVIRRDPESIRRLDKRYFVTDLLWEGVNAHLASGETHLRKTMLTPTTPLYVSPGIISNFKLEIGDDPEAADKPEPPLVRGFIRRSGGDPGTVEISSNGKRWLRTGVGASYESFEIPDGALKPGVNDLIVTTTAGSSSGLFAPLFESGKFRRHIYRWFASDAPDAETITPEGLLIRDTGNHERDIANVAIAYNERGSARVFDFECRVIDSDDDLAVCARGADGLHYETVSLRPGRVRLMNSGFEYELDTTVFHRYVIILTADQLRFEIDGSEVFQTRQELKPLLAEVGISLLSYYLDGNEISIPRQDRSGGGTPG